MLKNICRRNLPKVVLVGGVAAALFGMTGTGMAATITTSFSVTVPGHALLAPMTVNGVTVPALTVPSISLPGVTLASGGACVSITDTGAPDETQCVALPLATPSVTTPSVSTPSVSTPSVTTPAVDTPTVTVSGSLTIDASVTPTIVEQACPSGFVGKVLVISTGASSATVSGSVTISAPPAPATTIPVGPITVPAGTTHTVGVCVIVA